MEWLSTTLLLLGILLVQQNNAFSTGRVALRDMNTNEVAGINADLGLAEKNAESDAFLQALKDEQLLRLWMAFSQKMKNRNGFKRGRRGSCMFHAGLGHNCDYKDLVDSVNESNYWGSALTPGKK